MRSLVQQTIIALFLISVTAFSDAASVKVSLVSDLSEIEVSYAPGSGPLESQNQSVWDALEVVENGRKQGRRLHPLVPDKPLVYRVSLTHSGAQWAISSWHSPLRLSDWHDWLLTPLTWSMTRPLAITVRVPDGGEVAMPFERSHQDEKGIHFRAYPILQDHGGMSMFGNVQFRLLKVGSSRIELAVAGDAGEESEKLFKWADDVLRTAVDVHGAAPGHATIMMVPVPLVGGIVPWAHVRRGGGSHIIAYVKEGLSPEELYGDWTLFHEVTHLYHPYLHGRGRWVSEGFASYYQNVYRARASVVSPEFAYSRLQAGLERGRNENESAGNLTVTRGGRMRTYWTGAALAYQADAHFFEQDQDGQSSEFAKAIGRFAEERMPVQRSWHPRDYLASLDSYLAEPILVDLYDEYVRDRFFPQPEVAPDTWRVIFGAD